MEFRIFVRRDFFLVKCPLCRREGVLEKMLVDNKFIKFFLNLVSFRKYHCSECKWEGYLFRNKLSKNYKIILLNYLLIISLSTAILAVLYFLTKKN